MSDDESFVDVSVAQDGGIKKKILTAAPEGALGPPPNGNEVEAHYTGEYFFSLILFSISPVVRFRLSFQYLLFVSFSTINIHVSLLLSLLLFLLLFLLLLSLL